MTSFCLVDFLINNNINFEMFQPLVFSTITKTYTCTNCNTSLCFLQIGNKNCSGHVLTLLVVSKIDGDRFLSY